MPKPKPSRKEFLAALERKLEARRERVRKKRRDEPEYFKLKMREFLARNPGYQTAAHARWTESNRAYVTAKAATRRAMQYGKIPACCNFADVLAIYELAEEFRRAGFQMHVDHIIPLQHPLVCGLHTAANLRPCTAEGNVKKGNDYPSLFLGY